MTATPEDSIPEKQPPVDRFVDPGQKDLAAANQFVLRCRELLCYCNLTGLAKIDNLYLAEEMRDRARVVQDAMERFIADQNEDGQR